jgi:hypothetical protein
MCAAPGVLGGSNILFFGLSTTKIFTTENKERCATQRKEILNDKIFVVRTSAWKDYINDPLRILNTDPRDWVKVGSN